MKPVAVINPRILKLPLLLLGICMLCYSANTFAQDTKRNHKKTITFRGNKFELKNLPDENGGHHGSCFLAYAYSFYWVPVKINGEKIFNEEDLDNDGNGPIYVNDSEMEPLLLGRLNNIWKQLPDGDYYLDVRNIVTDKRGRICYFEYETLLAEPLDTAARRDSYGNYGIRFWNTTDFPLVPPAFYKNLEKKVAAVFLNGRVVVPGKVNGRKVITRRDGFLSDWRVRVINHEVVNIYCAYCPVFVCGYGMNHDYLNPIVLPVPAKASRIATDTLRSGIRQNEMQPPRDSVRHPDVESKEKK